MNRAEKKQRAKEREDRVKQREVQNGYIESPNQKKLNSTVKSKSKPKKQVSGLQIFIRTFVVAFAILTVISLGVTSAYTRFMNINLFEGEDKFTPILEEELDVLVDEDSPFFDELKDADRANVLVLGVNGNLTDTIMLVSFDRENKKVDVISVPRDTYYHRKGYEGKAENKLNAAYKGNPVNSAKAVSEILLGMPINYYAVIEYDGVENIVDSMGGVPMDIPNIENKGGMYYKDPYDKPPLKIAIPAGQQTLDGEHAVQFLRFRHGYVEADLGRVKAQQAFVKSAFKQCLSLNLPTIAKTVFENVDSDITIGTALGLAKDAVGMSSESISTYTIPHTLDYYVYPDSDGIEKMIKEIYSMDTDEGTTTDGAVSKKEQ